MAATPRRCSGFSLSVKQFSRHGNLKISSDRFQTRPTRKSSHRVARPAGGRRRRGRLQPARGSERGSHADAAALPEEISDRSCDRGASRTHRQAHRPDLLQTALDEMVVLVARAEGVLIEMLYSDDPRRLERAAEKILSSYAARNRPLSPAKQARWWTMTEIQPNRDKAGHSARSSFDDWLAHVIGSGDARTCRRAAARSSRQRRSARLQAIGLVNGCDAIGSVLRQFGRRSNFARPTSFILAAPPSPTSDAAPAAFQNRDSAP